MGSPKRKRINPKFTKKTDFATKSDVSRMINGGKEKKEIETYESTNFSAQSHLWHLTEIAQGDNESQRDGLKVRLRRLKLRVYTAIGTSVGNFPIRIVLFSWNDPTAPNATDVLNTVYRQPEDLFYDKKRGFIYYDKMHYVNKDTKSGHIIEINKPMKNLLCSFNSNTGASITAGQIYLLAYASTTDSNASILVGARMWYVDV